MIDNNFISEKLKLNNDILEDIENWFMMRV
jgi:hypothetical protein